MKMIRKKFAAQNVNDANLVMYSLGGDQNAFCKIVERYQNLLCSLAYSAVGDIKHSEDIAQEAFVDAWKQLDTLQEPAKLKAWLCGILRFKISRFLRKEAKHQISTTDAEHTNDNSPLTEELERDAISQQQQSLMWKVLDSIDDNYRAPLILYYREQQSVESVAEKLDISTDTAKQRLSRGRKILKESMSTFVEDALSKSKPGIAFTTGVMSLISSIAPPAKAAALGAGATKTSSVLNFTAILTLLAAISGVISSYFGFKSAMVQSRTQREKALVVKSVVLFMLFAVLFVLGMLALKYVATLQPQYAVNYTILSQLLVIVFTISYFILVYYIFSASQRLRAQERIRNPAAFEHAAHQRNAKAREYISPLSIFGIPLINMQFGKYEHGDKPAFGWIAGGHSAYGLLFAWGGVAIAPISVGIISVGVISLGAIGIGILGLGTVAIGYFGFGASAIGYKVFGSLSALGWESAISGGFSIAHQAAIAPIAYAAEVNSDKAAEISNLTVVTNSVPWLLGAIVVMVILPAIWHSKKVQKRMK